MRIPELYRKLIILSFFILYTGIISAQKTYYSPLKDFVPQDSLIKYCVNNLKKPLYKEGITDKHLIKQIDESSLKRSEYFNELSRDNYLMHNDKLTSFVQSILDYLVLNNKDVLDSDYTVFVVRRNDINAFSISGRILLINLGFFERFSNWEELAFVLGHELGHDYLQHAKKQDELIVKIEVHDNYVKEIKKASRKSINRYSEINKVYYNMLSLSTLHSRNNEISSDSIGYEFIKKSKIDIQYANSVLAILDSSDYFRYRDSLELEKVLSTKDFSIDPKWLINTDANSSWSVNKKEYIIPDSLKTHPDCSERKQLLKKMDSEYPTSVNEDFQNEFNNLRKTFEIEALIALVENKHYSLALFNSLSLQHKYPEEVFLRYVTAHLILELGISIMNQEFSMYTDFPNDDFPYGYNLFLQFLHNMNSRKLLTIYQSYSATYLSETPIEEYQNFLKLIFEYKVNKTLEKQLLLSKYDFPFLRKTVEGIKKENKIK